MPTAVCPVGILHGGDRPPRPLLLPWPPRLDAGRTGLVAACFLVHYDSMPATEASQPTTPMPLLPFSSPCCLEHGASEGGVKGVKGVHAPF